MRLIKYSKMGNLALYCLYCPWWWFSDPIMMSDEGNTTQATSVPSSLVYTM